MACCMCLLFNLFFKCDVLCFCAFGHYHIVFFSPINHSFPCAIFYCNFWNCISHPYPNFVTLKRLHIPSVAVLFFFMCGWCWPTFHILHQVAICYKSCLDSVLISSKTVSWWWFVQEGCFMLLNIIQDLNSMHFLFLAFDFANFYWILFYFFLLMD